MKKHSPTQRPRVASFVAGTLIGLTIVVAVFLVMA
jgi:hypothetical protein